MTKRSDPRPQSLADISRREQGREQEFDVAVREFLDRWQSMSKPERLAAIDDAPPSVGAVKDAYLAAMAEHLASEDRLPAPDWTEQSDRFLVTPFFAGGLQALKAILLVESPPAFRRRLIFISADGLSRPRRDSIQENALNVSNLDV